MPECELITIGSELLNGSVLNTNTQFLSKRLSDIHIRVARQVACHDSETEIVKSLSAAFTRSDLIILTGGLGPTPDDVTREAVSKFFNCGLIFNPTQYRQIGLYFKKIHKVPPFMTRQEAYLPEIAKPLLNRFGIALGFYIEQDSKLAIVLPGVPRELINMFESVVRPLIEKKFPVRIPVYGFEAHMTGIYETFVMKKLGKSFFKNRVFEFGIYPEIGQVSVRIKSKDRRLIHLLQKEMSERLGKYIYSLGPDTLPQTIGLNLIKRKKTIAVAESCTGGLLAEKLTDPPGASNYFKGGVVSYSDQIKIQELGIPRQLIRINGAVSKEVAQQMAKNVRSVFNTSIGVSITGIAGPSGGSKRKPVGLVYIGISDLAKTKVWQCNFVGERSKIRLQSAQKALFYLYQWLQRK